MNEIKKCASCGNVPDVETEGDCVTIGCKDCGFSVSDSNTVNGAIEWWNRCNMTDRELAEHGIASMAESIDMLNGIIFKFQEGK